MKLIALGILLSALLLPLSAFSQLSITTPGGAGAYSQDFNGSFLGTGDYFLNNDAVENRGWYSLKTVGNGPVGNVFVANTGTSLAGEFYNFGLVGDADRAFGSVANAASSDVFYGLRFQNDTGSIIQSVRVQYTGEQWRAFFPVPQTLAFAYQVSALDITTLNLTSIVPVPALNFVTPVNTFGGPLNGNLAANRVALDQTFLVSIPPGSEIMLRWSHAAAAAVLSHGVAIDDVTVTFQTLGPTAAGVSISGRVTTANGIGIGNATLALSGGQLEQPLIARTNPFGYYHIDGAPAGSTYLLEISAKRYTFAQPAQVIHAPENVTGVDFVAE